MAISQEKEGQIQKDLEQALRIAKKAWEKAEMPTIFPDYSDEAGKPALAILACKVLDIYGNHDRH